MKKTVKQLRDLIGELKDQRKAIHDKSVEEKRSLTEDEKTKYGDLRSLVTAAEGELAIEVEAEAESAQMATRTSQPLNSVNNEAKRQKDIAGFSFTRAIRSQMSDTLPLDGIEKEMHEEALKEARSTGASVNGVGIPLMVLESRNMEKRDNSITMPTQPEDGAAAVGREVRVSLNDVMRQKLIVQKLGATYYNDLVGNVSFTKIGDDPVATWKPEVGELDKSNIKFTPGDMSPKRIGTYIIESKLFLLQTAASVEAKIREKLAYAVARGIDRAALVGSGISPEPRGLMNSADVPTVAIGANGGAFTRATMVAAITALLNSNIDGKNYGWAMNALSVGALMNTPLVAGSVSDRFLVDSVDRFGMYPLAFSNQMGATANKGTGTGLTGAIFGAWENLYIAQWGGYDLIVNPYTFGRFGQVEIDIQAFADVLIYEPKAFVKIVDIKNP